MKFVSPRTSIYARHKSFSVEVMHYQDDLGDNKWFVYAYLFDNHPRHAKIDTSLGIYQDSLNEMPLHLGCSYAVQTTSKQCGLSGESVVWKIGADYSHLHDDHMQRQGVELINNPYHEPLIDAKRLYEFLAREYDESLKDAE